MTTDFTVAIMIVWRITVELDFEMHLILVKAFGLMACKKPRNCSDTSEHPLDAGRVVIAQKTCRGPLKLVLVAGR